MIRRLGPDEFELLREVRLAALADAPEAFGSSYSREVEYTPNDWRHLLRADGNPTFVHQRDPGHDEPTINGMVVAARDTSGATGLWLVAMWVRPSARGVGVGEALVRQVVQWAETHAVPRLRLTVVDGNVPAEHLYARNGFVRTGRVEVRDRDGAREIEMQLDLTADRSD